MKAGSKILDSEGKTGLELLNSAGKVQFCGDGILAEVVKSSWTGSMKTGTDEEGANEKSAEKTREAEKESGKGWVGRERERYTER